MSGGKGGRSNTEVTMPKFAETALQQGIGMAEDVSATGYVPYYGPDVAAFSFFFLRGEEAVAISSAWR